MVASFASQKSLLRFQLQSTIGSSPPLAAATTGNSAPAQMPNSPVSDPTLTTGGVTSNTWITISKTVSAPSLSAAIMLTVSMPASFATKVPVKVAVSPSVTRKFSMTFAPMSSVTSKSTVWVGSGPRNSTSSEYSCPKQSTMVSHPRLAVGTGFKLLLISAVLMLKNLKSSQLMPSSLPSPIP